MSNTRQLIESYYKAFNNHDTETLLSLLSDDVIHDVNQGSRTTKKEEFKTFMQAMDTSYDEQLTDMVIMISEDGTRASAEFICHGTYKATAPALPSAHGQTYKILVGAFFEVRNNKISRVTNYYNLNDWIKQVK